MTQQDQVMMEQHFYQKHPELTAQDVEDMANGKHGAATQELGKLMQQRERGGLWYELKMFFTHLFK